MFFFNKLCLQRHYMSNLQIPENTSLPFLAYGSFKPGELRYNLIKEYVSEFKPVEIVGLMKEKDGIPIFLLLKLNLMLGFSIKHMKSILKKKLKNKLIKLFQKMKQIRITIG